MKKQSLKNVKVFKEDWKKFMILCMENEDRTQPEMFKEILEEFRIK